jgi:hypothetical protein
MMLEHVHLGTSRVCPSPPPEHLPALFYVRCSTLFRPLRVVGCICCYTRCHHTVNGRLFACSAVQAIRHGVVLPATPFSVSHSCVLLHCLPPRSRHIVRCKQLPSVIRVLSTHTVVRARVQVHVSARRGVVIVLWSMASHCD